MNFENETKHCYIIPTQHDISQITANIIVVQISGIYRPIPISLPYILKDVFSHVIV